ncbi:autotransporter domain-containing protein [Nordella sp. HKS 07]|uniref:autotransporter domain-containing protein n=1 Tax=Nordella sp. HKS 07 TaxID=2712222 RepID=UPI0013E13341|nr:autotransporter domain-containing protein [Nordella sp. HKS 07]QIG47329.1 autotransporter domain-containing protein [Nordella sp. HKS 07]
MERHIKAATQDVSNKRRVGTAFRSRLALTTVLTVVPFISYGRQAVAASACVPTGPSTYSCGGASAGETINIDSASVATVAGFSVTAAGADNGITITGDGRLSYIDTNASPITSENGTGLLVHATGNIEDEVTEAGGVIIDTNGNITGATGIDARNDGAGDVSVTVGGAVTGRTGDGISALNYGNDLTITTGEDSDISGGNDGIEARNHGEGDLDITVNGNVTGWSGAGIVARNGFFHPVNEHPVGDDLTVRTGTQSEVTGERDGIFADNDGYGELEIFADGTVQGYGGSGIRAENSSYGTNLIITTGAESVIIGHGADSEVFDAGPGPGHGIYARNDGSGDLDITANGQVTGLDGAGIYARNSSNGINLAITTGAQSAITGSRDGIYAENYGEGNLDITVNGLVEGLDGDGIYADNDDNGVDLTVSTGAQSEVIGEDYGIYAENDGRGKLEITVNGAVTGRSDDGIYAENSSNGTGLTITTGVGSVVWGYDDGIYAEQNGDGDLTIIVNGKVTGYYNDGIETENDGSGETIITIGASGIVEGNDSAIDADSDYGQDISITNLGTVRNRSGSSSDRAIETDDGDTTIKNYGNLIGTVDLGDFEDFTDSRLNNAGFWDTSDGWNDFGGGEDEVTNSGVLRAANDATENEETLLGGLERFDNDGGQITLVDGAVGDTLVLVNEMFLPFGDSMLFDHNPSLTYSATNGRLAVDAVLGAGDAGKSDTLEIHGNVDEASTTTIAVNVVGVSGVNVLGIPVVKVINGETGPDNFSLAGPVNAGLFAWDLRFDEGENWYELFTSGVGIGGYEMAAGLTGAQEIWHQTTGTLAQRQADLRPLLNGTQVTPVADFTEPVAPTAAGRVGPGFWFNAVGGWLDRDAETDGVTLDRKQSIYGGLAGFDFATDATGGDTWLFGLFGGYLSSTLKFSETNSEWTYDGPTVGAYATYLSGSFYADVTVKADFLSIDIEQDDLGADDSDTDGINLGGRIDAGYKIGGVGEGVFFEPQATLAVLNTDIDDTEVGGGDVDFDSETSIKGRLGLKLGYDHIASNAMVYSSDLTASVWQEFNGSNDASISATGLTDFGVSDDTIGTLGDISLGFSVTAAEGWSGFLRGSYQFAEDFDAITGNAGVRYSW